MELGGNFLDDTSAFILSHINKVTYLIALQSCCPYPSAVAMLQATYAAGTISGTSLVGQDWETLLPNARNTVQVGGILSDSLGNVNQTPNSVTVAGIQCSVSAVG